MADGTGTPMQWELFWSTYSRSGAQFCCNCYVEHCVQDELYEARQQAAAAKQLIKKLNEFGFSPDSHGAVRPVAPLSATH